MRPRSTALLAQHKIAVVSPSSQLCTQACARIFGSPAECAEHAMRALCVEHRRARHIATCISQSHTVWCGFVARVFRFGKAKLLTQSRAELSNATTLHRGCAICNFMFRVTCSFVQCAVVCVATIMSPRVHE